MSINKVNRVCDDINKLAESICSQISNGELEVIENAVLDPSWRVDCVKDDGFTLKNKRYNVINIKIIRSTESFIYASVEVETIGSRYSAISSSILIKKDVCKVLNRKVVIWLYMLMNTEKAMYGLNLINGDVIPNMDKVMSYLEYFKFELEMELEMRFGSSGKAELKGILDSKPVINIPDGLMEKEVSSMIEYIRTLYITQCGLSGVIEWKLDVVEQERDIIWDKMKECVQEFFAEYGQEGVDMISGLQGIYDEHFLITVFNMVK